MVATGTEGVQLGCRALDDLKPGTVMPFMTGPLRACMEALQPFCILLFGAAGD